MSKIKDEVLIFESGSVTMLKERLDEALENFAVYEVINAVTTPFMISNGSSKYVLTVTVRGSRKLDIELGSVENLSKLVDLDNHKFLTPDQIIESLKLFTEFYELDEKESKFMNDFVNFGVKPITPTDEYLLSKIKTKVNNKK